MKFKFAAAALTLPLSIAATHSLADEMWRNGPLLVYWAAEVNGFAQLDFTVEGPKLSRSGTLWVQGLTATDQNRATYGGFWTSLDGTGPRCQMPAIDPNGNEAWTWGRIEITFYNPTFPSGWSAALGHCFDEAMEFMEVEPAVSEPPLVR
jgi:hypothetical protein